MSSTPDLDRALEVARVAGLGKVALDRAHGELRAMKELLSGKTLYDARQATLVEIAQWAQFEAEKRPQDSAVLYSVAAHCWCLHSHAAGNAARAD